MTEIDIRNSNSSFLLSDFFLNATGHPNLTCVLVNAGDLATAQNNVSNSTWQFDNANVVGVNCAPTNNSFNATVDIISAGNFSTSVEEGLADVELQMTIPGADTDNLIVDFDIEVVANSATSGSDYSPVKRLPINILMMDSQFTILVFWKTIYSSHRSNSLFVLATHQTLGSTW